MPKSFSEKYDGKLSFSTILSNRFNDLKDEIKVQLPCKVHSVNHTNNQVDLEILDYAHDESGKLINYPIIPDVPIRQPLYSGSAYIYLPVRVGDIGTIEFFDTSVDDLITTGNYDFDYTEEWHSLNNGLFTNGFLPKNKLFAIDSNAKIVLGSHSGSFTFKVNADDTLTVVTPNINITTGTLTVNGDIHATGTITGDTEVIGNGKALSTHTHKDSQGGNTSAPL